MTAPALSPIRVAPSGRYFETFEGDPFMFIGPNDAISWPGLNGLYARCDPDAVDAYLGDLAAHGVTVLRLMLEYCQTDHRYFERPAGRFNPPMVRFWDDLFARCEQFGLRVLLAPWDNFWMARRFHRHPYNAQNGGPAASPGDFFTHDEVIDATIHRFRFVVERWGGSGVIAAWDLFNEIHPFWGGSPAKQASVITRISEAIRTAEQKAWGFTRPQTLSVFGPAPDPEYEELVLRHPSLDFATTHIYEGAIDYPRDALAPAELMGKWVRYALARAAPGRPFMDTEHGPIHLFNDYKKMLPEPFDNEYERHLMWAHLASGGAGSGMRWPARHPHLLTFGMRRALRSLAAFAERVDWRHFTPVDALPDLEVGGQNLIPFACRDERQAVIWLLTDTRRPSPAALQKNVPLTLRGLCPGDYCVETWDTISGRRLECLNSHVGEERELRTTLSTVEGDLAMAVRPCRNIRAHEKAGLL